MFRFMICDDDACFCGKEKQLILDFYGREDTAVQIDVFHSGEEIVGLGKNVTAYDAVFLDVKLKNVNGIDLAGWLKVASPSIIIVFVSGSISYALDGYKVGAVRYIMKDEESFAHSMEECLRYILRTMRQDETDYISLDGGKVRISVEKILYVESRAHKVTYHLVESGKGQQSYSVYGKLDDIERMLEPFGFCRIHQSYLVNMNYVRDVSRYTAVFLDETEIQISKNKYKAAEEKFIQMKRTF